MIVSMLIARSLGPSEYGVYVFLIWLVSIAVSFANEGLSLSVTKHVAEGGVTNSTPDSNAIIEFFEKSHLNRIVVIMIPLALAAYLNSQPDVYGYVFSSFVAVTLSVCFFLRARHMLRISTFKGLENFWGVAIAPFVMTPINMLSAIVLYMLSAPLWMYLVQYLVVSLGFYFCTRYFLFKRTGYRGKSYAATPKTDYFERVKTYNRYITPSAILTYLMASQTEIYFLNLFSSNEVVAFFNVGFVLATAIATLVPGVINMVLLPMVSRSMSQGIDVVRKIVEDTLRYQLYLNFLVIGPTILYADDLVHFLYGEEYIAAAQPFLWMVLIYCASNFVSAFNSYLLAADEHKLIFKVSVWGAVFGITCDVVLIYLYGLDGAIVALALTMLWYVVTRIVPANRKLKARLSPWHLALTLVCCAVLTVAMHFLTQGLPGLFGAFVGTSIYVMAFSLLYYFSPVIPATGKEFVRERLTLGEPLGK